MEKLATELFNVVGKAFFPTSGAEILRRKMTCIKYTKEAKADMRQ